MATLQLLQVTTLSSFSTARTALCRTDRRILANAASGFARTQEPVAFFLPLLRATPDTMRVISDRVGDFAAFAEAPRSSVDTSLGSFSLVNRLSMTSSTWDAARRRLLHRFGNCSQLPFF